VFGGDDPSTFPNDQLLNDVWALSLAGGPVWTQLSPAGTLPIARIGHTSIYDPVRDRMVVFGGSSSGNRFFGDVWALSLVGSGAWANLTPGGPVPEPRIWHTAIYDGARDCMVLFGGFGVSYLNDVWITSLPGAPTWTQLTTAGPPPSGRYSQTAIYDPVRDRMVVFGGYSAGYLNDVWALSLGDSPAWTQLVPAGTLPSARAYHSAIYDPVRDRLVVFGGYGPGGNLDDLWALSLAGSPMWTQLSPAGTPPSPRFRHTAIYDPVRDRMVVFGGIGIAGDLSDAWALSMAGTPTWSQLTPSGTPPGARAYHTAIYDPVRDRMVVFGGDNGSRHFGDVWALSLADSPAWTQLAPAATPPSARDSHASIYDPVRDRMTVFGGYDSAYLNDVWDLEWGSTLSAPPTVGSHAMWLALPIPNPSRSDISIEFELSRPSHATLRVYDASGRVVRTLIEGSFPAGTESVSWDRRLSSGVLARPGLYFYELGVDGHRLARRVVLIQ
jgi:hypothetical protein